jgi:hypothetical protein
MEPAGARVTQLRVSPTLLATRAMQSLAPEPPPQPSPNPETAPAPASGPVDRLRWLEQVAADARLGDADVRFAIAVQSFVNRRDGFAFASAGAIGERARVSERTARLRIAALTKCGYLRVERRGPHPAALILVVEPMK